MSEAVLSDAQFSVARVFKPFPDFETTYQGLSTRIPILFPGTLDPDAGRSFAGGSFDANLVAGIPVPYGSKVQLWFPTIYLNTGTVEDPELLIEEYRWQAIWRLRNLRDFKARRSAYHFARESAGASNQFVVPATQEVVLFEGPKQTLNSAGKAPGTLYSEEQFATHQGILERYSFPSATPLPGKVPGGAADASYQQGVSAFAGVNTNRQVTWNKVELDAGGDELILALDRLPTSGATWNFTTVDQGVSLFFGTGSGATIRDLGVYVFTGANP